MLPRRKLTLEMTWGETEYTQREGNKAPLKESRCFALTSIELLDGALDETSGFIVFSKVIFHLNAEFGVADSVFEG